MLQHQNHPLIVLLTKKCVAKQLGCLTSIVYQYD